MHYLFKSKGGETYYAMLAPWWYLEENGIELEDGIKLKIWGSVVEPYWNGHDDYKYIIATKISVDGVTLELRDQHGYPLWHGTGWHYYSPTYSDGSVADVTGEVLRSRTRTHGKNLDPGYEIIMRAEGKRYVVFVAPQWHVEAEGFQVSKGDSIKVRGSVITKANRLEMVASRITVDGKRWRFRDNKGIPLWIDGAK